MATVDLLVVGGGINGAGIAADAAGRGLSVTLCEQQDLASATSSASTKLIHGGLRYLEHYQFRLVREALAEREVLLQNAPHIVSPLRFRLPHQPHLRPAWMIRLGLFLYDHLGKRVTLPPSKGLAFGPDSVLEPAFAKGFEYSDCWVDDARLVVLNALAASQRGATILPRTRCSAAAQRHGLWQIQLEDSDNGERQTVQARALVNAAGPWVTRFIQGPLQRRSPRQIRLVKGSHIVVPRIHAEPQAYILQNRDRRIVFVIPYLERYSLIGTTDMEYRGDPALVAISEEEITYLCEVVNQYFRHKISPAKVVWHYAGVRPLCDDESRSPSAISRDYTLELEAAPGAAPLLSVFGGKLTTYRKLAETALHQLQPYFPAMGPDWTAKAPLPGGQFSSRKTLQRQLAQAYPFVEASLLARWVCHYGTLTHSLLAGATTKADLGNRFGADLYQREVDYLLRHEFARRADDILWRRSKLGLSLNAEQAGTLQAYVQQQLPGGSSIQQAGPEINPETTTKY